MRIRVTRQATNDLRDISNYIRTHNPSAALRVERSIRNGFLVLQIFPHVGRLLEEGVRRLTIRRYPYLVFYDFDEASGVVSILSIRHAAREPAAWPE